MKFHEIVLLSYYMFIGFMFQFPAVTMRFYLIETCKVSPTQMQALQGVVGIPWTVKVLYGFVSDAFPICGYRRRPYIIMSMLVNFGTWLALSSVQEPHIVVVGAMMTLSSLTMCVTDVMVDSILVINARDESEESKGSIQSHAWGARFIGGMIAAVFGGIAYENIGHAGVFIVQSCAPLIMLGGSFFLLENKVQSGAQESQSGVKSTMKTLGGALRNPDIYKPALFIFLINCTPDYGSAMTFFYEKTLGFSAETFALLDVVGYTCAILSTILYRRYLRSIPFRTIFAIALFSSFLLENTLFLFYIFST